MVSFLLHCTGSDLRQKHLEVEHGRGCKTPGCHQSREKERKGLEREAGGAFHRHTPILTYFLEQTPPLAIDLSMDIFMTYPIVLIRALVLRLSLRSLTLGIKSLTGETLQGYFISKSQHSLCQGGVSGLSQGF